MNAHPPPPSGLAGHWAARHRAALRLAAAELLVALLIGACASGRPGPAVPAAAGGPASTGRDSGSAASQPAASRSAGPATPASASSAAAAVQAVEQLRRLGVNEPAGVAYDRALYGRRWADVEANGCNQRDDVLLRDAVPGSLVLARQGSCGHDVLAGRWSDPYSGTVLSLTDLKDPAQARAVQIDHLVPLAEAHRSGAAAWGPARRELFANDLANLRAVAGELNAAKSDQDPAGWRPARSAWCSYARAYVAVKHHWQLTVDRAERAALNAMLRAGADQGCPT